MCLIMWNGLILFHQYYIILWSRGWETDRTLNTETLLTPKVSKKVIGTYTPYSLDLLEKRNFSSKNIGLQSTYLWPLRKGRNSVCFSKNRSY